MRRRQTRASSRRVDPAAHGDDVEARHLVRRVRDPVGQPRVRRQQQQARGRQIEPADGDEARGRRRRGRRRRSDVPRDRGASSRRRAACETRSSATARGARSMPSTIRRARSGTTSTAVGRGRRGRPRARGPPGSPRSPAPATGCRASTKRGSGGRRPAAAVFGAVARRSVSSSSHDLHSTRARRRGRASRSPAASSRQRSSSVKADGSGTIEQRTAADRGRDGPAARVRDPRRRQRRLAPIRRRKRRPGRWPTSIGPGVTYVSSTPVKTDKAQGRDTIYAFTDITQLHISEQPRVPGGVSLARRSRRQHAGQSRSRSTAQPDGNA